MKMKTKQQIKREERLLAYALAVGAAGVPMISRTADGAIEYFDIEDISIGVGGAQTLFINDDTYVDILLKNYVFAYGYYQGARVEFAPGKLVGFDPTPGDFIAYASLLANGDPIGPSSPAANFYGSLAYGANNPLAEFNSATDGYIGFSFPAGPDLHYAWVRVDIDNATGTFIIKDFAFENTPDTQILAGATSNVLDGDLNLDGFVGVDDLNIVLVNWNQNVTPGDLGLGDATGEGFVGVDDLNIVLVNWNNGAPPPGGTLVPEPGALSLLAAGAAGVTMMRRRKA